MSPTASCVAQDVNIEQCIFFDLMDLKTHLVEVQQEHSSDIAFVIAMILVLEVR